MVCVHNVYTLWSSIQFWRQSCQCYLPEETIHQHSVSRRRCIKGSTTFSPCLISTCCNSLWKSNLCSMPIWNMWQQQWTAHLTRGAAAMNNRICLQHCTFKHIETSLTSFQQVCRQPFPTGLIAQQWQACATVLQSPASSDKPEAVIVTNFPKKTRSGIRCKSMSRNIARTIWQHDGPMQYHMLPQCGTFLQHLHHLVPFGWWSATYQWPPIHTNTEGIYHDIAAMSFPPHCGNMPAYMAKTHHHNIIEIAAATSQCSCGVIREKLGPCPHVVSLSTRAH